MKHRHSALIAAAGLVIVDLTLGMGASAGVGAPERRVAAERAGAWTETGRMAFPRSGMEAVLLPNGKVLAIGDGPREDGRPGNSAELLPPTTGSLDDHGPDGTASVRAHGDRPGRRHGARRRWRQRARAMRYAEVYRPGSGTWKATGSLKRPRKLATATLLQDGRVLVVGGLGNGDPGVLASAELYDPATGRWTSAGKMATPRSDDTATLLEGGQVLVAGGTADFEKVLASAELYDPVTGSWSTLAPMQHARVSASAVLLESGLLLVAGGWDGEGVRTAELYDPATGAWTETGDLRDTREGAQTIVLLRDGRVLLTGGFSPTAFRATAETYDPGTGRFTRAGRMTSRRGFHAAVVLRDGSVLVAGGRADFEAPLDTAEIFDPS